MSGRPLTMLVALSAVVTALMLRQAGQGIVCSVPVAALIAACVGGLAAMRFAPAGNGRHARACRDMAESVGLFASICLLGAIASYPAAARSSGFVDPALLRVDRAIGFDWVAWYAGVAAHPALAAAGRLAYQAIYLSPALLLGHYAWTGARDEARAFILAFWLAAVLTLVLFVRMPSLGPLAYAWRGPIPYMPTSALYEPRLIPALRSHLVTDIDLGALRGLVGAPSFHATSGVLYAAFGWRVARLRWPLIAINAAMLLATPVEGTHYLAEMIVGALVAMTALSAAGLLPIAAARPTARVVAAMRRPRPATR